MNHTILLLKEIFTIFEYYVHNTRYIATQKIHIIIWIQKCETLMAMLVNTLLGYCVYVAVITS